MYRMSVLIASLAAGTSLSGGAALAENLRIGIIAPEDGSFAILGDQTRWSVQAFAAAHPDDSIEIVEAPEFCEGDEDEDAAASMVEAGIDIVVGLFCAETVLAVMPILAVSDIPAITLSVRSEIVMEDAETREWPLFRLAPPAGGEARKIAEVIGQRWVDSPFALIDDGTIYGRDLVETVRLELEETGITPSFMDNFRPAEELQFGLVRRLASAGVTHVFVGGDRNDVAIMARDAAAAELDLAFMGGDALFAPDGEVPLQDGVLAIVAARPGDDHLDMPLASALQRRLLEAGLQDMRVEEGYILPAYAAAEIARSARAAAGEPGAVLVDALREGRFETVLGPVDFTETNPTERYRLMVSRDGMFVPVGDGRDEAHQ